MPSSRVPEPDRTDEAAPGRAEPADGSRPRLDPATLPMPGVSRRRLAQLAGLVVAAWLLLAFGRQVAQAAAASDRADDLRGQNTTLRDDVAALQTDLARVQGQAFIRIQGRAAGLGKAGEIPFTLEAGAPTPGPTAPGSASVRLGAKPQRSTPLDGWLSVLFGPGG
jgi:cell division protein FtsB